MCKLSLLKMRSFAIKLLSAFWISKPKNVILVSSNLFIVRALKRWPSVAFSNEQECLALNLAKQR